jgi:LPS export ABC transporter permease LptG
MEWSARVQSASSPPVNLPRPDPRRRFSPRLFRYLLGDFLVIFLISTAAFLTLLLIAGLIDDLEEMLQRQVPVATILRYFLLLQPDNLVTVLPMALLLSAMYTVAQLQRHNELAAISASGIALTSAFMPLFATALIVTVGHWWLGDRIAVQAHRQAVALRARVTGNRDELARLQHSAYLAYRQKEYRRDWLFGDFSQVGASRDVFITQFRANGTIAWELHAAEAQYRQQQWEFTRARLSLYDEAGEYPVAPPEEHPRLIRTDLVERPDDIAFLFRLRPAEEQTVSELHRLLTERGQELQPATRAVLATHFYYRLAAPWACLIGVLLGIPLAISRERSATMRSFLLAALVMAGYHVATQFFVYLGKRQLLPPPLAAFLPTLAVFAWGCWEMRRKR